MDLGEYYIPGPLGSFFMQENGSRGSRVIVFKVEPIVSIILHRWESSKLLGVKKKFCSDRCRLKWWNAHMGRLNKKTIYTYICLNCGSEFKVYGNQHRK